MGRRLGPKKRWRVGRLLENANECGASKNVGFVFMRRQGFTLIEVLIAMAVIGVGLIALVTLFPVGLRSSRLAGDFTAASFIAQQALDNIRASAQVYDPGDLVDTDGDGDLFDDADGDGLGYYELPVSAVKGSLSPLRFPNQPERSQWWKITMTAPATFSVSNSIDGAQGTGTVGTLFESTNKGIKFILSDNLAGNELGGEYNPSYDITFPGTSHPNSYPNFEAGDEIIINIEMQAGVPYYWYAMRAPVTEDINLDGILGGRLPDGTPRGAPYNQVHEDVGLDLVPDFYDTDMRTIGTGTAGYQSGLDQPGEFTTAVPFPADPHGDNRYAYDTGTGWWNTGAEINPAGTEGNGQIDAFDDNDIQKVTVVIGWREGGQDRAASFSAAIANQFR